METRVVVANKARARIFAGHGALGQLAEVEAFVHGEARLSNQALVSDAPGRAGDARGKLDPATSPKEIEAHNFALLLARRLKDLHNERHFDRLVLVAPPAFLGLVRKALHAPLDKLVERTLSKDLTTCSIDEIVEHLRS